MVNADDQLRKDVDDLYNKIKGDKGLVTSEELDKAIQNLQSEQYDISEIDSKVAQFNSDLEYARTELNSIIEEAHDKLDDGKEDKANKTSSFNTTPNNTRYPSEKLVKDNLDLKSNKSDIIDDLTHTDADKPLSANQGRVLNTSKAPNNHRSSATTYGVSTATYYGHSKASNSTPVADTQNGAVGTVNGVYANANHSHPKSSLYADAVHKHNANQVYYHIDDEELWTLIKKSVSTDTLTGLYGLIQKKYNLYGTITSINDSNKTMAIDDGSTVNYTTILATGYDVYADVEDEYIKELLDSKRNISDTISATDVDVMVGSLHQTAQSTFENILYWQSQHSGGSGGSSNLRIFRANARWDDTNKYFNISSVELPDSWTNGDIFIINFPTGGSGHLFSVSETINQPDYFMVNGDKHYAHTGNLDLEYWFHVDKYTSLILIFEESWYDNGEMSYSWKIVYNGWAWTTLWDLEIKDNLTSTSTTASLSANQGRILNEKISNVSNWTTITLNTYATLYVNEAIQMCELVYNRSFASATAGTSYNWHTGLIDEVYRPSYKVHGLFEPYGYLYVDTDGTVSGKFPNGFTSRTATTGRVMWHY